MTNIFFPHSDVRADEGITYVRANDIPKRVKSAGSTGSTGMVTGQGLRVNMVKKATAPKKINFSTTITYFYKT